MTFSRKIFLSVFISTLIMGSGLIVFGHYYVEGLLTERFTSRYQVLTNILADTLKRLDSNTESLMLNAAKVVASFEKERGGLSDVELKRLRDELNVTHLFMTDSKGKFTHSTNEDPKLIPNLFSFCDNYPKLISGELDVEATPIIKPDPEPKPYKFLSIPNHNRTKIIEVAVRVDFIAKTLVEAMKTDTNILSLSLFAPDGTPFGRFGAEGVTFKEGKELLPTSDNKVFESKNDFKMYTEIGSSHTKCCQCDKAGTSKNGNYYYVIKSDISKAELKSVQATAKGIFLLIGLCNIILAYILSKVISRALVKNIEYASKRVEKIKESESLSGRINLEGTDEVAYLTKEFDNLLETLEKSQGKVLEAEKVEAKVQLAREVGHNIRSPIIAIEMMLPTMFGLPIQAKNVLKNAVQEIKALSEKLSKTNKDIVLDMKGQQAENDLVLLPVLVDEVVQQKIFEYSNSIEVAIESKNSCNISEGFVEIEPVEFKSVLSNLINNAIESYGLSGGFVSVDVCSSSNFNLVTITDKGAGIPNKYINRLGREKITFKGESGRGTGLTHAFEFVNKSKGQIDIESELGGGTKVSISLPQTLDETREQVILGDSYHEST